MTKMANFQDELAQLALDADADIRVHENDVDKVIEVALVRVVHGERFADVDLVDYLFSRHGTEQSRALEDMVRVGIERGESPKSCAAAAMCWLTGFGEAILALRNVV